MGFLLGEQTNRVIIIHRHRSSLIEESSKMVNKMQKSLRLMNLRLDVVLSDITGKSGMAIINAILQGERDGNELSKLADRRVKQVEYNPIPDQDYKFLLKQRAIKSIQYRMNKLKITSNELSMC